MKLIKCDNLLIKSLSKPPRARLAWLAEVHIRKKFSFDRKKFSSETI